MGDAARSRDKEKGGWNSAGGANPCAAVSKPPSALWLQLPPLSLHSTDRTPPVNLDGPGKLHGSDQAFLGSGLRKIIPPLAHSGAFLSNLFMRITQLYMCFVHVRVNYFRSTGCRLFGTTIQYILAESPSIPAPYSPSFGFPKRREGSLIARSAYSVYRPFRSLLAEAVEARKRAEDEVEEEDLPELGRCIERFVRARATSRYCNVHGRCVAHAQGGTSDRTFFFSSSSFHAFSVLSMSTHLKRPIGQPN